MRASAACRSQRIRCASYAAWPRRGRHRGMIRSVSARRSASVMSSIHLHDELAQTHDRVVVETRFGQVTGGRSRNGAAVFLGKGICCPLGFAFDSTRFGCSEIPYALPPQRFENPVPLPSDFRYQRRDFITESSCQSRWFHPPQSSLTLALTSGQTRHSPLTTAKLLVCMDRSKLLSRDS
jgi:hypothetical protein